MAAEQRPYKPLLDHLTDKGAVPVAALPEKLRSLELLNLAWIEGVVEFGRQSYGETGEPSQDSKLREKRILLEPAWSWTGVRSVKHKALKDILEEDKTVPTKGKVLVRYKDPDDKKTELIRYDTVDAPGLKLHVRITDKGFATLAA